MLNRVDLIFGSDRLACLISKQPRLRHIALVTALVQVLSLSSSPQATSKSLAVALRWPQFCNKFAALPLPWSPSHGVLGESPD